MPTKSAEHKEAKRQAKVDVEVVHDENEMEPEGSHSIDHMTILDSHERDDTNKEPTEDIAVRKAADLSFWNNSWTWVEVETAYGNEPKDRWFINPTAKLIGEVMQAIPEVYKSCEVVLVAGEHTEQLAA